ncbi:MAG: PHP domain-containing protein [Candidatus Latescibacteria bacterium]|nr:PHP domain-containing protein [Candidatus Latescibacterota bacterium]
MNDRCIDLHIHSDHSDGTFSINRIITLAHRLGLAAISITDHDTIGGLDTALQVGKVVGVEVIPGVELSAAVGERDIHLLGYCIDPSDRQLLRYLTMFKEERYRRAERIVRKLNGIGLSLDFETVMTKAGSGAVGRPHIADALVTEGFVSTTGEAFAKYIGYSGPAYEAKYAITPDMAIQLIRGAGGMVVIAHPGTYDAETYLPCLLNAGAEGIEVIYPKHTDEQRLRYEYLAETCGLVKSGGSDCHGDRHGDVRMGTMDVPYAYLEAIRNVVSKR